jgi:hypothetical protein
MSYTITIFNHPDMGIDIAGLPPEQRKRKRGRKVLDYQYYRHYYNWITQYRLIAA